MLAKVKVSALATEILALEKTPAKARDGFHVPKLIAKKTVGVSKK
jgi:hypothetical protein